MGKAKDPSSPPRSGARKPPAPPARDREPAKADPAKPRSGGPHPDPTRYGDWEKNGRCIDF